MPSYKVELAFEQLTALTTVFTLDANPAGQLDNASYPLSDGGFFVDVSQYVKAIRISRGKSRDLDQYTAAQATVQFNNTTRAFDPTYTASPFYGEIVPRRKIRISIDGENQYVGIIDDYNLIYTPDGQAVAEAHASDAFAVLNKLELGEIVAPAEDSGSRIDRVINSPGIEWPIEQQTIDTGSTDVAAQTIAAGTNALEYIQKVEATEFGNFFVDRGGNLRFRSRNDPAENTGVILADDNTGIKYSDVRVVYGSELLYNDINLTSAITSVTKNSVNLTSEDAYGTITLNINGLLFRYDDQMQEMADYLVQIYGDPELRYEQVAIQYLQADADQQRALQQLDLGDLVDITFTPNGLPPAIVKKSEIVKIEHDITLQSHVITLGFSGTEQFLFILDNPAYGILDTSRLPF